MSTLLVLLLNLIAFAFVFAALAAFYFQSIQPGGVLDWWAKFVHHHYDNWAFSEPPISEGMCRHERYQWMLKPFLTCVRCIGGQVGLWSYLTLMPFSLMNIILVAAMTSVFASILYKAQA